MRRLRGRIAFAAAAATAVATGAVLVLAQPGLERRALAQDRSRLLAEARLVARVVEEPLFRWTGSETLSPPADEAARALQARVTIIAADGRVVGDSAVPRAELANLDNHAHRPEVLQAISEGVGSSVRRSATVKDDRLYAAVAVLHEGHFVGVTRVSEPIAQVVAEAAALRRTVAGALALAFLVTAGLFTLLSGMFAGPLGAVMEGARQLGAGKVLGRIPRSRDDELGELAGILNGMADERDMRVEKDAWDHARTEAILASLQEGLLVVDHRGIIRLANDVLCRDLLIARPTGRHYVEVVRHVAVIDLVQAVLTTGDEHHAQATLHHPPGVFAVRAVPFPLGSGLPHGAVLSFQDRSALGRLERVRRDFVANVSHELRTPLTSIRGFVEALEEGALEEPATSRRFLGKIRVHADHMADVVHDLLELSQLDAADQIPRLQQVPPAGLVARVITSFGGAATAKGLSLASVDLGAPAVPADPEWLCRILEKVVDNAIKYTPPGGHVVVCCRAEGNDAVLEVEDDGPGIPPEHLPRIFERFYRVDPARGRDGAGTGLGLSIARHLAEAMGATLEATSQVGRGSRFFVRLSPQTVIGRSHRPA